VTTHPPTWESQGRRATAGGGREEGERERSPLNRDAAGQSLVDKFVRA
jgi:hypothetical protein